MVLGCFCYGVKFLSGGLGERIYVFAVNFSGILRHSQEGSLGSNNWRGYVCFIYVFSPWISRGFDILLPVDPPFTDFAISVLGCDRRFCLLKLRGGRPQYLLSISRRNFFCYRCEQTSTMTDDARRTLYCLVEDEHVVFKVIVLVNNHCLEDLKNLVQQEKKDGALGNVNTSDIILFKVTIAEVNTAMLQLTPFE